MKHFHPPGTGGIHTPMTMTQTCKLGILLVTVTLLNMLVPLRMICRFPHPGTIKEGGLHILKGSTGTGFGCLLIGGLPGVRHIGLIVPQPYGSRQPLVWSSSSFSQNSPPLKHTGTDFRYVLLSQVPVCIFDFQRYLTWFFCRCIHMFHHSISPRPLMLQR